MKLSYIDKMKKHMVSYKKERLGVNDNGVWVKNGKPYPHILPKEHQHLNILEPYRLDFWTAKKAGEMGFFKLHSCFHHLTSSQAMCFNLFFPFLHDKRKHLPILLQAFGLPDEGVVEAVFEKKLVRKEGTAFDFYLRYKDGLSVTFESKFTEADFGGTKQDARHEHRFRTIYAPMAKTALNPTCCEMRDFLGDYQFLRNLIYLGTSQNARCLFILPKADPRFSSVEQRIADALLPQLRTRAKVVWLEDIIHKLCESARLAGEMRLCYQLDAFREKYLPLG